MPSCARGLSQEATAALPGRLDCRAGPWMTVMKVRYRVENTVCSTPREQNPHAGEKIRSGRLDNSPPARVNFGDAVHHFSIGSTGRGNHRERAYWLQKGAHDTEAAEDGTSATVGSMVKSPYLPKQ